jgi:hypothetical protein
MQRVNSNITEITSGRQEVSCMPARTMDGIALLSSLQDDSDITELSQQLLALVNRCIPKATEAYENQPKKSNADALNLFISQSRELANDLRSLHNKKIQTNKIIKECLSPAFIQINEQMLNIPNHIQGLSAKDYEEEVKLFMSQIVKQVFEKLKEIL